jgi:hypothetical protein
VGVDVYTVHLHRPADTERNPVPFCRSTKGYRAQSFKPEAREAVWLMKAGSPPMVRLGATGFSVPLCPPIGEVVIYREFLGGGLVPMMVHSSERKAGKGGQAVVEISGYIPSQGRLQPEVLGPSVDRGCWDWKGERS